MPNDEKVSKALFYATVRDATDVLEVIPVVGDLLSDPIEDMALREIQGTLSQEELRKYLEASTILPEVPAMAITLRVFPPSPSTVENSLRQKGWKLPPSPLATLKKKGWAIP